MIRSYLLFPIGKYCGKNRLLKSELISGRSTDIWQDENSLLTLPSKGLKDPRFDWKQMARQQREFVKCQQLYIDYLIVFNSFQLLLSLLWLK